MTASIDTASRVEIVELFAAYCHTVDHGDGNGCAALFTEDSSFEVADMMRLQGQDQLRTMPGVVTAHGGGKWRHQVTSIMIKRGSEADTAVRAYGLITDWGNGGKPANFSDYDILLRRSDGVWRIASLMARLV